MTTESTAIVQNPKEAYKAISEYLFSKRSMLAGLAPKLFDTDQLIRVALGASSRNPQLLACTQKSWLLACMDSAYLGLEAGPLGHAYLVPRQNRKLPGSPWEVQFMAGYRGLILLACESGGFEDIEARMVYTGEIEAGRFEEQPEDPHRPFRHRPLYQIESRGDVAGCYAVGWRGPEKRPRFKYITVDEVEAYRARSQAAKAGPWVTDWDAMAMKTAVRRMLAMAQLRPGNRLGELLAQESATERGEAVNVKDWEVGEPSANRTDELAARLARKAGKEPMPSFEAEAPFDPRRDD